MRVGVGPGQAMPDLTEGQAGCFFLHKHPEESFYVLSAGSDFVDSRREEYGKVVAHVVMMYRHLMQATSGKSVELEISVDSGNSTSGSGMVVDHGALGVVPVAGTMQLVHAPTGITPRRLPFDIIENFTIAIGAEAIVPQTAVLTYTFIAN